MIKNTDVKLIKKKKAFSDDFIYLYFKPVTKLPTSVPAFTLYSSKSESHPRVPMFALNVLP